MSPLYPANFWTTLSPPIVGLAPMDGVTDFPFRSLAIKYGQPSLVMTEFVNVEGLAHNPGALLKTLWFVPSAVPTVAQLYGKTPALFRQAAMLVAELGLAGIDLNMGCPSKNVAGGGAGAGLIKTPQLAQEIIRQTKQGLADWQAGQSVTDQPAFGQDFQPILADFKQQQDRLQQILNSWSAKSPPAEEKKIADLKFYDSAIDRQPSARPLLPLSIKTRLGTNHSELATWLPYLLEFQPAALTLHGRTLQQAYRGLADWEQIGLGAKLAKRLSPQTLVLGNGDVSSYQEAVIKTDQYHLAGVLIGRAAWGNPLVFQPNLSSTQSAAAINQHSLPVRQTQLAIEHAQLFEQTFSILPNYSFWPMRKHLGWYVKGWPQAKQLRQQLVHAETATQVSQIIQELAAREA